MSAIETKHFYVKFVFLSNQGSTYKTLIKPFAFRIWRKKEDTKFSRLKEIYRQQTSSTLAVDIVVVNDLPQI